MVMADTPPLLFKRHLGGLYPANPAAERALTVIEGTVRVEIKRSRGNQARLGLYWIVLGKVAPALSALCEGDAIDESMLHRILKDRRGLYTTTTLPSGHVEKNYDSISFAKMAENERADYVTWAFETLAKWLKVEVSDLTTD